MGLKVFLSYIATHFHAVFGITLALFFLTCMILLIRSIGEKQKDRDVGSGSGIDVRDIEGAMKRVLASQPVSVVASSIAAPSAAGAASAPIVVGEGGGADPAVVTSLQENLRDRETRIATLNEEIEKLRETLSSQQGDNSNSSEFNEQISGLKAKNEELQARLAEYEIIEDDIADLSMFKEENARLKEELERLKAQGPATAAPAAPAAPAVEMKFEKAEKFELDPNDDIMKEFAAAVSVEKAPKVAPQTEVPAAAADAALQAAIDADPQAAIDAMLAAAMGGGAPAAAPAPEAAPAPANAAESALEELLQSSDLQKPVDTNTAGLSDMQADIDAMFAEPKKEATAEAQHVEASGDTALEDLLNGTPDPDKMLGEVESLVATEVADGDALEESLDTDKLLAEVDDLKAKAG